MIIAAAIRWNGMVFMLPRPNRHHHILHVMHWLCPDFEAGTEEQGFLTSEGNFVTRQEAMRIARAMGQVKPGQPTPQPNDLFSEDLW